MSERIDPLPETIIRQYEKDFPGQLFRIKEPPKREQMSGSNGRLIKIEDEGVLDFQFGSADGSPIVKLDVIAASEAWGILWARFYTEKDGDKYRIPADKREEFRVAQRQFVQSIIMSAADGLPEDRKQVFQKVAQCLNERQVLQFVHFLSKEAEKMADFLQTGTGNAPSPQVSSEVTYSE